MTQTFLKDRCKICIILALDQFLPILVVVPFFTTMQFYLLISDVTMHEQEIVLGENLSWHGPLVYVTKIDFFLTISLFCSWHVPLN